MLAGGCFQTGAVCANLTSDFLVGGVENGKGLNVDGFVGGRFGGSSGWNGFGGTVHPGVEKCHVFGVYSSRKGLFVCIVGVVEEVGEGHFCGLMRASNALQSG